ncbi:Hyaluronidase Tab [Pseudolycoriella hygida]|uniref:Hyaluronidase n=1 Tax=Pseudolycoriella hygida TaxID=35572 RepID=A0A9Q0S4S7_9DIPT|nr:Hyaluronidase Tab [Pseudolycoriella hygida]
MFVKYVIVVKMFLLVTWANSTFPSISEFTSYWNIPSFACSQRFNFPVLNVTVRYGITQNFEDKFRGNHISMLYDPGLFPAILSNGSLRNGGVPQQGDLKAHLEKFQLDVDKYIPDGENTGLAIVDFELWRPVYRQNYGKFQPYKDLSVELIKKLNTSYNEREVHEEASRAFTESAKMFMTETIKLGKQLRPKAKWGYYGLPHCFNGKGNVTEDCEQIIQDENDATQWLYENSDVIFPSIYMLETMDPNDRPLMVKGRIKEAIRLSSNVNQSVKPLVIAYHRYKFPDTLQYLNESDNMGAFKAAKEAGADGIVVWGAWKDLNTIEKCLEFYNYLEDNLGPSFLEPDETQKIQQSDAERRSSI